MNVENSEEFLESKTYKEICDLCRQYRLPRYVNRGRIPKSVMIQNLLNFYDDMGLIAVPNISSCPAEEIESASFGDILAFRISRDKAISGKMVARSRKKAMVKVETKKGNTYLVNYGDILWFKGDAPWPKPVYDMLKG